MKKAFLWAASLALLIACADKSSSQSSDYRTIVLSGTADVLMDSSLSSVYMDNKRIYINGIYWWYDNAVNGNQMFVQVVSGTVNMATAGAGRQFKYSEAMTSSGIKGTSMPMNLTTVADSTIFFVISGTGSDSLYMVVNYRFVN